MPVVLRAILALLSIALLFASLVVGLLAHRDAGRLFAPNIVFVAPLYDDGTLFFSQTEIERFMANFPAYEISAVTTGTAVLSSQTAQVRAKVFYASSAFYNAHFIDIIEGSPPQDYTNSVLLCELLAWRLFGGFNVTGITVWALGEPFVVSGVAAVDDIGYAAWLPSSARPDMPMSSIYIRFPYYNIVNAIAVPREMLGFRNHDEYMMLDINRYIGAIGIRNRLVLYVLWMIGLAWAFLRLSRAVVQVKEEQPNRREYAIHALVACFAILSAYVLFTEAADIIYALPNLSATNTSLTDFVFGWIDLPPVEFLPPNIIRLVELNARANIAFFCALASAFFLAVTRAFY